MVGCQDQSHCPPWCWGPSRAPAAAGRTVTSSRIRAPASMARRGPTAQPPTGQANKDGAKSKDAAKGRDAPDPTTVAAFCPDLLGAEAERLDVCTGGPAAAWYVNLMAGGEAGSTYATSRGRHRETRQVRCHPDPRVPGSVRQVHLRRRRRAGRARLRASRRSADGSARGTCYADIDCSGSSYCAGIDEAARVVQRQVRRACRCGSHVQARRAVRRWIQLLPRRQGRGDRSDVQQDPHVHPGGRQGSRLRLRQVDQEDSHLRARSVVQRHDGGVRDHGEAGWRVHGRGVGVRDVHGVRPDDKEVQAVAGRGRRLRNTRPVRTSSAASGRPTASPPRPTRSSDRAPTRRRPAPPAPRTSSASAVTAARPRRTQVPARVRCRAPRSSSHRWPDRS